MKKIKSKYYKNTPVSYKIFEAIIIFFTITVGGYSIAVFGPMYFYSKSGKSSQTTTMAMYESVLENQFYIILFLVIIGLLVSIPSVKLKKRQHVVLLEFTDKLLIVHTRKFFNTNIHQYSVPLEQLKIKRNTIKISVFFGREHTLEIYNDLDKVGDFLFNHFFWSNQKLRVLEMRRDLSPYIIGGEFVKQKEVEFFKS